MVRVVADANILVSAVIADGAPRKFLRRAISQDVELVLSLPILQEFVEVLRRPKFRMTEAEIDRALGALIQIATVIEVLSRRRVVQADPDDDVVVNTAIDGHADWIVSGDKHLLDLGEYERIEILSVTELLKRIGGG
jgi:putative PIN family toxin of toxin-antitoxin system